MICIPITASTHHGAMKAVKRCAALADVVELRMDLIQGGRLSELVRQARSCSEFVKVLVTHRRAACSGFLQERRRIDGLKEAVSLGADYVDVELETDVALRDELRTAVAVAGPGTALIVSHHDFRRTPSIRALKALLCRCVRTGADLVKIVTWASTPADNLRVFALLSDAGSRNIGLISFCMGAEGRVSRIAAPFLGSRMSYVTLHRGWSPAPGQLTLKETKTVMNILRRNT
jgi:3-dehydroquinate dehydratase type I